MNLYEAHRELEKRCEMHGSGNAFAASVGLSGVFINDVRAGRKEMTPRLLTILGFKKVCRLEKIND